MQSKNDRNKGSVRKPYSSDRSLNYKRKTGIKNEAGLRTKRRKSRNGRNRFVFIVSAAIFIVFVIFMFFGTNGQEIFIGSTSVGQLNDKKLTLDDIKNTITAQLESELGTKIQINEEISLKPVRIDKKKVGTTDYIISKVREKITYKVESSVISIDGTEAVYLSNNADAQKLLEEIKNEYIPEGSSVSIENASFVENVSVDTKFVDSQQIMDYESSLKKLTSSSKIQKPYTVASGDTLYKIASDAGITVEEILQINNGMTIETGLKVGQEINILVQKPLISVKTVETVVLTEKETKKQEIQKDNTKPSGYKKVIQQGKDGQKDVTVQVIRINGFEDEQKVINENITVQPVNEIIVVGTN